LRHPRDRKCPARAGAEVLDDSTAIIKLARECFYCS
jgi:hypothetical protein